MRQRHRTAWMLLSLAVAAGLVVALFEASDIGLRDVALTVASTPPHVLAALILIALTNQIISVIRWRLLARWLTPEVTPPPWLAATRVTLRGALAGQVVPLQLAMPAARWAGDRSSGTVKATIYEQLFDFILLLSCGLVALGLLAMRANAAWAMAGFAAAMLVSSLALPLLLRLSSRILAAIAPAHGTVLTLRGTLDRAADLPSSALMIMAGLSSLRLVVLSLRTVLVVAFTTYGVSLGLVALGYPIVGLALGVPFLPAGLGFADWSLAALVRLAGGTVAAGATSALALRILNFFAIGILVACFEPLRFLTRPEASQAKPAA